MINGERAMCQKFISILCLLNAATIPLKGAQDTLPFIGTMDVASMIAHMESEDLQSAFNLFAAPAQSLPYFAYSKKVEGAAFRASSWHLGEAGTGRYPHGLALGRGLGAGGGQDTDV